MSYKLAGGPLADQPCKPTLLLGLPMWVIEELTHVLVHDLVFSSTSSYQQGLDALQSLTGKELVDMTKKYGGSVIVSEDDLLDSEGEIRPECMRQLENSNQDFQAIVVDDSGMYHTPEVAAFCASSYEQKGSSIVIMALEGIFDLGPINRAFGLNWRLAAYTRRTIKLTDTGEKILGTRSFPFGTRYIKSHFVTGAPGEELFSDHLDPEDYDSEDEMRPEPGSAIVTAIRGSKSVSYFGFVNTEVSYGAIVHSLCCASAYFNDAAILSSPNKSE